MAIFMTGATQKLTRTTGLIAASSDYTCIMRVRPRSVPGGGDYYSFMVLKDAGYTAYAGIFTQFGSLATNVEVNNGGGQFDTTQRVLSVDTWASLAYVRSGTTHTFYVNASAIGNTTDDLAAVTFTELLIGYDGFSVNDFDVWDFREFPSALTSLQLRLQLESVVALTTPTIATNTPLFTDLLDLTANNHDFTATPGAATFEAGPADTGPVTNPLLLLTGTWVRYSTCYAATVPIQQRLLDINTGMTLGATAYSSIPQGGRTIARVSLVWGGFSAGGLPDEEIFLSSTFTLQAEYMSATTFALVTGGTVVDPWSDPAIGTPSDPGTLTWADVTPHRVAMAIRSSTRTGSSYASDGELRVYVDDVLVLDLSGLHFADLHPFTPSPTFAVAYGCNLIIDRVWARLDDGVPLTDADGVVLDTTNLWYQDDFATAEGNPVAWGPYASLASFPERYPNTVSNVGGGGTAGLSVSTHSVTDIIDESAPLIPGTGIVRLRWNGALTPPTPPVFPTFYTVQYPIRRLRRAPHLNNENKRVFYHGFELDFQRGIGIPGVEPGGDPQFMFRISRDGGRTWSSYMRMSAGELGKYKTRATLKRLGYARDAVFEITTSDPNNFVLTNAWLTPDPTPGEN